MSPELALRITAKNEASRALTEVRRDMLAVGQSSEVAGAKALVAGEEMARANRMAARQTQMLSYQINDIAVSLAGGQNPLLVMAQQGSQITQVFGPKTGVLAAMKAIGAGFVSYFTNPISLALLGFGALATVAQQVFGSMQQDAKGVADRLKDQQEAIDKIVKGYDRASDAVDAYRAAAERLPEAEALLLLQQKQTEAARDFEAAVKQIGDAFVELGSRHSLAIIGEDQYTALMQIRDAAREAKPDIDAIIQSLLRFISEQPDGMLKRTAQAMLDNAENARQFKAQLREVGVAIANIPQDVSVSFRMSSEFSQAYGEMQNLFVDDRSRFEVAREELKAWRDAAYATAETYSQAVGVGTEYARVLESINKAEAAAAAKANLPAVRAEQRLGEAYDRIVLSANQRIDGLRMEQQTLTMTAGEAARLTEEQNLLNQAVQAGITLTPQQTEELKALADQEAALQTQTEQLQQSYEFAKSTFVGFFTSIGQGVRQGKDAFSALQDAALNALGNIADQMMQMAASQAFNMIFGSFFGAPMGLGFGLGGGGMAALGSGIGFGSYGFASGGYTGNLPSNRVAGIVHGGEYVLNAAATRRIGVGNLNAMNAGASAGTSRVVIELGPDVRATMAEIGRGAAIEVVQSYRRGGVQADANDNRRRPHVRRMG
ncbi:MAG: phage tail length tape measure family protein [Hyphomicrobiaceae bacterium]|nr:phage tail length tape measure family protein [Hyphomicrobiaceae bacterium]